MEDDRRFFSSHKCLEQKISGRSLSSWTLLQRESERKNERFQVVSAVCMSSNNTTDRHTLSKLTYSSKYMNPCAYPQNPKPLRIPYLLETPDSNEHRNNQPLTLLFFFCFTNFKEMAKEKTKPNRFRVSSRTLLLTMADSMQQMLYQAGP
jgi:hypothetical protein